MTFWEKGFKNGGYVNQKCEDHDFWNKKNHVAASCAGSDFSNNAAAQVENVAQPEGAQCVKSIDVEEVVDLHHKVVRQQDRQFEGS